MRFFSDNAATIHPAVLEALARAQPVARAYDGDPISARLDGAFSDLFGAPVSALWISTGTAANAIALATLCPPHGGVLCHRDAHIQNDECGAPEFYTHGAKLLLVDGPGAKLTPDALAEAADAIAPDVHRTQPRALSITNATEYGMSYSPDEVAALGAWAKTRKLGFHMDGARFANALVHHRCSPAELTWQAGVDVLSFGFVKNGGFSAEALVFFDSTLADLARIGRKRGGHLFSKGRFMAAQLLALLEDDLWLANARAANAGAARIAEAAGARLVYPVEANEVFLRLSPDEAANLRAQGFDFYDWSIGEARLVISWDQPEAEVAALAAAIRALR